MLVCLQPDFRNLVRISQLLTRWLKYFLLLGRFYGIYQCLPDFFNVERDFWKSEACEKCEVFRLQLDLSLSPVGF